MHAGAFSMGTKGNVVLYLDKALVEKFEELVCIKLDFLFKQQKQQHWDNAQNKRSHLQRGFLWLGRVFAKLGN